MRGVISSSAVRSPNRSERSSRVAVPSSRVPCAALERTSEVSSSGERADRSSSACVERRYWTVTLTGIETATPPLVAITVNDFVPVKDAGATLIVIVLDPVAGKTIDTLGSSR